MNAIGVTQVKIKLADTTYILTYDMQALFYIDNKYESFQAFLEDIKVGNLVAVKVALEGGTLRGKQEFNPCLIHLKDVFIITSKIIYAISSNMPDNDKTHKATKSRDKSKTDLSKLLEQYYYIGLAELKLCRNDLLSMTLKELFRMIDINRNGIKTKKTVPLEAVI
ncbi:hypothetical protein [Vallitalea guaymasensis]|uniref:hypothetical protein n=1 Tax=Vallitalea guaymasensis TaxID=1185412 RepID=UPI000DE552AC|nr:hypothetical protein [Vallitalea guaymasensis]